MTKMADLSVLNVLLHGRKIGTLTRLSDDRTVFAFTEDYIEDANRATLSLSFKARTTGELITDIRGTRVKVPPFFSNLLPEGPLRRYLAERANVNEKREFFLLWVLGQDLPGAMRIVPEDAAAMPDGELQSEEADETAPNEPLMRFSLAGVQIKFSAAMSANGGLTIPTQGIGGSWIVKLPSSTYPGMPENEFSMLRLAREVGIDVPEIQLLATNEIDGIPDSFRKSGGQSFAIRRFDRDDDNRGIHIEDFAQVFGVYPENKYDKASYRNLARVIDAEVGEEGTVEFVRRLVFNALIGNADMHLKNWSLVYPDARTPELAPAYDFVSTIPYIDDQKMALTFAKSKKMTEVSEDALRYFANKAKLPEKVTLDTALETVELFKSAWPKLKGGLPMHKDVITAIEKHVQTIPIAN
jgi:serine/threonine-protein kinase HipA